MGDEQLDAANAGTLIGGPRRYRKKPVVIEAVQIGSDPDQISEVLRWCGGEAVGEIDGVDDDAVIRIETLEGPMLGRIGWYVIKGVKGEFYPCDPDVFAKSYEPA